MDFTAFTAEVVKTTVALLIIVDPLGNVPIFLELTREMNDQEREQTFHLATVTGLILLTFFTVVGQNILSLFGITLNSFMIAGGILLLIVAVQLLVLGGWNPIQTDSEGIGAVPIGCPLLVGPGAITASILNLQSSGLLITLISVLLTFTAVWLTLKYIHPIYRVLGKNGSLVITRVMALLIASIAVQYILQGAKNSLL
ncbi:MAG: MarC family protein [Thermoproteota archaeon]